MQAEGCWLIPACSSHITSSFTIPLLLSAVAKSRSRQGFCRKNLLKIQQKLLNTVPPVAGDSSHLWPSDCLLSAAPSCKNQQSPQLKRPQDHSLSPSKTVQITFFSHSLGFSIIFLSAPSSAFHPKKPSPRSQGCGHAAPESSLATASSLPPSLLRHAAQFFTLQSA